MASARAGLELPATSLIAPLLPAIPTSPARPAATFADLIQAACRAGNMNQGLVPAGFFALGAMGLADCAGAASAGQSDRIDVAAVVGFGAVGGAAEAIKPLRVGIGAKPDILDMADARPGQPRPDIAGEVEHGMTVACGRCEEAVAGGIFRLKAGNKIGADLIIGLPDHRSDHGADVAALGAKPLHGFDRRLDDARERAAPAGMRGADDVGFRVGEENRPAIGGADADGKRLHARDDGVGAGPRLGQPRRFGDHHLRRVNLIAGQKAARLDPDCGRHAGTVFRDMGTVVVRSDAAIEARIKAAGNAALAREEAVADAVERERSSLDHHGGVANPGSGPSLGSAMASALNNSPMPLAPVSVRRAAASSISSALSREALALSAAARLSMPSRSRRSRCRMGP